jgi:hypothetical protein
VSIASPAPSPDPKEALQQASNAYIACSLAAAKRLALQPEDPAHIAITAMTLCSDREVALRKAVISVWGLRYYPPYMESWEKTTKEHIIALVVTTRAKARQLQDELRTRAKTPVKKDQDI